ncbi:MAG: hypothetical protein QM740_09445 [Acidovorax sp.]
MTTISSLPAGSSALAAALASAKAAAAARQPAADAPAGSDLAPSSPTLTITTVPQQSVVYRFPAPVRAWAQPPQDGISALMARNFGASGVGKDLAKQWSGLGGALLSQVAQGAAAGPFTYQQTLLANADTTQPVDAQLRSVQFGATTVALQVKTRSGQTVSLHIDVNNKVGADGSMGTQGIRVTVSSTGALSDTERKALADLASGLDEALNGLGQDPPQLALQGLLGAGVGASGGVFTRLSLDIQGAAAFKSFALNLDAHAKTLALDTATSKVNLKLDADSPLQSANAQQRQAAIAQYLQQIDAAAQRSHADASLVALFKDGFAQMQGITPSDSAAAERLLGSRSLADKVLPRLSGLADFEASFSNDFKKFNQAGQVTEAGHVDYQISQHTTCKTAPDKGDASITQKQNESLKGHYLKALYGGELKPDEGNYEKFVFNDSTSTTTQIEARNGQLVSALQTVEKSRSMLYERLEKHRVVERRETPERQSFARSLLSDSM